MDSFVIALREGIEAALVVGITVAFVRKAGISAALDPEWSIEPSRVSGRAVSLLKKILPERKQFVTIHPGSGGSAETARQRRAREQRWEQTQAQWATEDARRRAEEEKASQEWLERINGGGGAADGGVPNTAKIKP